MSWDTGYISLRKLLYFFFVMCERQEYNQQMMDSQPTFESNTRLTSLLPPLSQLLVQAPPWKTANYAG